MCVVDSCTDWHNSPECQTESFPLLPWGGRNWTLDFLLVKANAVSDVAPFWSNNYAAFLKLPEGTDKLVSIFNHFSIIITFWIQVEVLIWHFRPPAPHPDRIGGGCQATLSRRLVILPLNLCCVAATLWCYSDLHQRTKIDQTKVL